MSPQELSLRLHELIESRLQARIMELEAALEKSLDKLDTLEMKSRVLSESECSSP